MPRPDSPPVFGKLLDRDGGTFAIDVDGAIRGEQEYISNTNILVTRICTSDGSGVEITDYCPRFEQYGRVFQPIALFRVIEPIGGNPIIRIRCQPVNGWEKQNVPFVRGNSHLRFDIRGEYLRVLTNMPLTYLCEETSFSLSSPVYFGLTWNTSIEEDLITVAREFLEKTSRYWRHWVKHCSIPTLYQKETIRSALTLKLHCYSDTGAILAATTTSLPEEIGGSRNWDYRYSWLRDAYFVLSAFDRLGQFEEKEQFIAFLLNIVNRDCSKNGNLAPVYRIDLSLPIPEEQHAAWLGYCQSRPVRSGNQAAEHIQNDVYGEMILSLAPIFLDERFRHLRTKEQEGLLSHLGELCLKKIGRSDAGPWEFRGGWREHSFSTLMCWAGIDRLIRIQQNQYLKNLDSTQIRMGKTHAESALRSAVVNGVLRNGPNDSTLDASLLLLPLLNYTDSELSLLTVDAIWKELKSNENPSFLYRYKRSDDFGEPRAAFILSSFWLAQSLARLGRVDAARGIVSEVVKSANTLGLFSEHFDPIKKSQLGNFPQAFGHVGLINAAFAISPPWEEII